MLFSTRKARVLFSALLLPCLPAGAASGDSSATRTDLASIVVKPLSKSNSGTPSWQTVYAYSGGSVLPPGTSLIATGKWLEPVVRKDKAGITFAFPPLPSQPQAAQDIKVGYAIQSPLADYPTRLTARFTAPTNPTLPVNQVMWPPFVLTSENSDPKMLAGQMRKADAIRTGLPVNSDGENTMVYSIGAAGDMSITLNDQDVTQVFNRRHDAIATPGAMLVSGLALRSSFVQQPANQGDWFTVNALKIEQLRPSLESSAVAAVDLKVPGDAPIRVTIEIIDDKNCSRGYLLRDALVSPGSYHLFWDGIDQARSRPQDTSWIAAGTYSFHLTTSKTRVHYAGEINNSAPPYNRSTYGLVNSTALAMTPPGTTVHPDWAPGSPPDQRTLDPVDSVQMLGVFYDANYGQWVGSDGTVFSTKTGGIHMQSGRGLAVTPPDPQDPTNPAKQFYFVSRPGFNDFIISASLPSTLREPASKTLTGADWNRAPAGFLPYHFKIGQLPYMAGQQHYLFFQMSKAAKSLQAEWVFRNIRLYEEGSSEPAPLTFDASKFTPRLSRQDKPTTTVEGVAVEDEGHAVHLTNSGPVNYPLEYTITPHTVLAFELNVIDHTHLGNTGNGIGLDTQNADIYPGSLWRFVNFTAAAAEGRGVFEPALGAYNYPFYDPNTLYPDAVPVPPANVLRDVDMPFLWQPGFYGVNVSEDGKLLFVCNNADNRLEVRDISTDGQAIAKIPLNYPMFAAFGPAGQDGAPAGTRYIYITSPKEGILRIPWKTADNSFGKPENLTPASEFAYPRGIAYDAVTHRLFVCDTYTYDRSKNANQIAVIDAGSGKVLSRFGRSGGVDPHTGGKIADDVFTCPLTIAADSKGALWINDYYSCEVRKYTFNPKDNAFKLERRVLGPNTTNTSHFYWMPGDPPTRIWTFSEFLVRHDADIDSHGRFTNPRTTSTVYNPLDMGSILRPYAHFLKVGGRGYAVLYSTILEQVGDGWKLRSRFGGGAGRVAREAGLLALPGQPPTDLDKVIAASGDPKWERRAWAWTDLNGDGKIDYTAANPELQINLNSDIELGLYIPRSSTLRTSDGAFVVPANHGLAIIPPTLRNGQTFYTWDKAKLLPLEGMGPDAPSDVILQDGRYYTLFSSSERHDMGDTIKTYVSCYDEAGKLLWTRDRNDFSLTCLQPLGDKLIAIMDRGGWNTEGPVIIRTMNGDLVSQVHCQEAGDCWSNGVLRSDSDTAYVGIVQAYKVTGLASAKTAAVNVALPAAGP